MIADNWSWLSVEPITAPALVNVKLRSSQKPIAAEYEPLANGKAKLIFREKQKAVACGQSAVLYDDDGYVLGGGIIESAQL